MVPGNETDTKTDETPNDFADVQIDASDKIFIDDEQPDDSAKKETDDSGSKTTKSEDDKEKSDEKTGSTKEGSADDKTDDPDKTGTEDKTGDDVKTGDDATEKKIAIGEKEYSEDEIKKFIEDSENNTSWQTTNTQKAQELSEMRKAIEPITQLMNKLKDKSEFSEDIREALKEEFGDDSIPLIDAALSFDTDKFAHPFKTELDEANEKIAAYEAEGALRDEMEALAETKKLKKSEVEAVKDFAVKTFTETGEVMSLATAYKAMNFDQVKEKADSKALPKIPDVSDKQKGAKDIKKDVIPDSFEKIKLDGFNIME